MDMTWEYAMTKTAADGPVARTAAQQSFARFKAALAAAGERAPLDHTGAPMLWSEGRGWFPRPVSPDGRADRDHERHRPRTLADMDARQAMVTASIRQDRVNAELDEDRKLIASAMEYPMAWHFARSFRAGMSWPGSTATEVQRLGYRLARRGWGRPEDIPRGWRNEDSPR